jgi:hypothetical protein
MKGIATFAIAAVLVVPCLIVMPVLLLWASVSWFNRNHVKVSESVRDGAKVSKVVAALAALWAWLLAPTGLVAIGASLGIVNTPLVVILAPMLMALAGAALTVSTALDLYSKWRTRRNA